MLEGMLNHIDAKVRRFRGTDPEIEFTVERGVLSVLQARMAETATEYEVRAFEEPGPPTARGIGLRGGAFRGLAAFDEADLEELRAGLDGERTDVDGVLILLENPTPDQIPLLLAADAALTARGGSTSHAAVAIHGIDEKPYTAVMSAAPLRVDAGRHEAVLEGAAPDGPTGDTALVIRKGDVVSLHGGDGAVWLGTRPLAENGPTLRAGTADASPDQRREPSPAE
jgi:phosphoenolpyruvate synthase/pyruvate phosphate dikinase